MLHPSDASIASFAEVARGYCSWCEGDSLGPDPESKAAGWLARLYAAALALPDREAESDEGMPDLPQPQADRAKANLAPFRGWYYREFFDPHPHLTDESCMGDVGDDLLDVYCDLRAGLVAFDVGHINDAAWHWSFQFRIHWGRHAVGGLFALHSMHVSKRE
ncbi:MAG TPA: DUF5063 domain-containing protein [Burkholderiaceae bacterium]|jgi:hypothetical protein